MHIEPIIFDDETINSLATDWYFLTLQTKNEEIKVADEVFNELIDTGLKLKPFLHGGKFSRLQPMNVYVDGDTYFDLWLDENDQIQSSGLYNDTMAGKE